jgi:phospholipid/cholesterol/gamma-HCH transport system substrate-binding protein
VKDNLGGVIWRLGAFVVVCALGTFALLTLFAQLRFQDEATYKAQFANVSGLEEGNFVRIAGVEVGKVKRISLQNGSTALVEFSTDRSVMLTEGSRAAIRYDNPIGGRFMELIEGTGGTRILSQGQTIPTNQTEPALDLDALIGGFRPLFRALDPDQINALSSQLIDAFQGQGTTINSVLANTAALTGTLADRDALIGQVIGNLNTVLGSLGGQSDQFAKAIDSLSELVNGLADRKGDISNSVAYSNAAAGSIADLLAQARPPLGKVVVESDRANSIVLADHEYFDDLLNTLPESYRMLARQGLNGDYFSYYLCDLLIKVNGKGGQPVYIKLAGQDTGRCTPK